MSPDGSSTETPSTDGPSRETLSLDGSSTEPRSTDERGTTGSRFASLLLGHLSVAALAAVGGVVLGGWLAFETSHWQEFKAWIEGLAGGVTALAVGLLLLAAVVSVGAAAAHADSP